MLAVWLKCNMIVGYINEVILRPTGLIRTEMGARSREYRIWCLTKSLSLANPPRACRMSAGDVTLQPPLWKIRLLLCIAVDPADTRTVGTVTQSVKKALVIHPPYVLAIINPSVRPSVHSSVRHKLGHCKSDSCYDHAVFTGE